MVIDIVSPDAVVAGKACRHLEGVGSACVDGYCLRFALDAGNALFHLAHFFKLGSVYQVTRDIYHFAVLNWLALGLVDL
jgi:hypothetical protein